MRHLMCSGISTIIAQKNVSKIFLRIVEYWIFQSSVISADHSKRNNKVIILKDSVTIQILKRNSRLLHCVVFKSFTLCLKKVCSLKIFIAKPKEPESQVIESIAVLTAKTAVEEFGELWFFVYVHVICENYHFFNRE